MAINKTPPPQKIIRRGRLNGRQRLSLRALIDMEYTPTELAEIIGVGRRQVYRVYEKMGCPHRRDDKGKIWINGSEFVAWYEMTYAKIMLGSNQAYCRTCNKAVDLVNPEQVQKGFLRYLKSKCGGCGRTLIRFTSNRRKTTHKSENQTGG